jgi:hypothetical protein
VTTGRTAHRHRKQTGGDGRANSTRPAALIGFLRWGGKQNLTAPVTRLTFAISTARCLCPPTPMLRVEEHRMLWILLPIVDISVPNR